MKLSRAQKKRAIEQMHDLMLRLPLPQDIDCIEQCWTAAEDAVDSYISAAEARTSNLPPRERLGEACFHLISLVGLIRDDDNIQLVSELLTPEFGVELYGLLPRVKRLRDQAVAKLSDLAEKQTKPEAAESATDFDLF
ncbi:hypothetical protein QQ994_19015 [Pseudomonas asiatica]|uniref:hypothetical protein n=1 Tax=Pseudomonas asiatica TaxID=2219225 RepID=UPI00257064BF|nr:hypothetical protein [Pseudomonas asiatica]WJD73009.1 hypothetical protein QQ994_19015 [Pseudomonas asiatica]HDS0929687.1 hypothetical protein [Pseudomonas putida]